MLLDSLPGSGINMQTSNWLDLSVALRQGMPFYPGDAPLSVEMMSDVRRGDAFSLSRICLSSHAGTHIDAPAHFVKDGLPIDRMPLDLAIGRARLLEIRHDAEILVDEIAGRFQPGEALLFRTRNSERQWWRESFRADYVHLESDTAAYLVRQGVRLVGSDYLSIAGPGDGAAAVHRTLLAAGIWIIEGLDLSKVSAGVYELICLPLKIAGGDGAPARVIARRLDE